MVARYFFEVLYLYLFLNIICIEKIKLLNLSVGERVNENIFIKFMIFECFHLLQNFASERFYAHSINLVMIMIMIVIITITIMVGCFK